MSSPNDKLPPKAETTTSELQDLEAKLHHLAGENTKGLVDVLLHEANSDPDDLARDKHNARTALYKHSKALSLTPDSEAIALACSYVLLGFIRAREPKSEDLFALVVQELVGGGYDKDQSHSAIGRLLRDLKQRRGRWRTRTRQRLARQVAVAINALDNG